MEHHFDLMYATHPCFYESMVTHFQLIINPASHSASLDGVRDSVCPKSGTGVRERCGIFTCGGRRRQSSGIDHSQVVAASLVRSEGTDKISKLAEIDTHTQAP